MKVLFFALILASYSQTVLADTPCAALLSAELNSTYARLLEAKEQAFWEEKMAFSNLEEGAFGRADEEYQRWISDPHHLAAVREALASSEALDSWHEASLRGWERFFGLTSIDDPLAQNVKSDLLKVEEALQTARYKNYQDGYIDPKTKQFVPASSTALSLIKSTHEDELMRRAAYEGSLNIEQVILENGFVRNSGKNLVGLIEKRNQFAQARGFKNFCEMKVKMAEGISLEQLFHALDDLENATRDGARALVEKVVAQHGPAVTKPWNWGKFTSGSLTNQVDPFFSFQFSVRRWLQTFSGLGIDFNNATINIDLVDRPSTGPGVRAKFPNGFAHFPLGSFVDEFGVHHPMQSNFTANAVPGAIGSGKSAAATLHHEGGHDADYANVMGEGPQFGQEHHGSSVPRAETSSMFLDAMLEDPQWLARYATDASGNPMPDDLIVEMAKLSKQMVAFQLRWILAVSYFERAVYEMPEHDLTPAHLVEVAREIEKKMLFIEASPRPIMSIIHIMSDEASGYYHSYALAQAAVYQVEDYFKTKYGYIADNPNVGPEFKQAIWRHGTKQNFFSAIEALTGKPFSADATRALVNISDEDLEKETRAAIKAARARPAFFGPVDPKAILSITHGDKTITSLKDGKTTEEFYRDFESWIQSLTP